MRHLFITAIVSAFYIQAVAQDVQTVCPGAVSYYHINEPNKSSQYVWKIEPEDAGTVKKDTRSHGRVSVKWQKDGVLSVQEVNVAGCEGEVTTLAVKISAPLSAEFDNEMICYGEKLNIQFPEDAAKPLSFTYSIDGEKVSVEGYDRDFFPLESVSGTCKILSVSDANGCTITPVEHATAVIAPELKKLIIKKE